MECGLGNKNAAHRNNAFTNTIMKPKKSNRILWKNDECEYDKTKLAFSVLPFSPDKVDLNKVPASAQEYLQQVITERKLYPNVSTAERVVRHVEDFDDATSSEDENDSKYKNLPSVTYIVDEVNNFKKLREDVNIFAKDPKFKISNGMPKLNDENGWFDFCFTKICDNNINSVSVKQNTPPLLNILLSMSENMKERLIEYLSDWLKNDVITAYVAGSWLYALFATIELPPTPLTSQNARIIAQKCIAVRSKMNPTIPNERREIAAQNLMICLISKFFGSSDLSTYIL